MSWRARWFSPKRLEEVRRLSNLKLRAADGGDGGAYGYNLESQLSDPSERSQLEQACLVILGRSDVDWNLLD